MSNIVLRIDGLELHADDKNDEPRVLDLEIGRRAEMARPRDIRKTIARHIASGFLCAEDWRATVAHQKVGNIDQVVTSYWLTEVGSLKLIAKLETPAAHAMVGEMVRVYREAVRQLREPSPVVPAMHVIDSGPRMGDSPEGRAEVRRRCAITAKASDRSLRAVLGFVRRMARTSSPYFVTDLYWRTSMLAMLDDVAMGRLVLSRQRRPVAGLLGADTRQQKLFGAN